MDKSGNPRLFLGFTRSLSEPYRFLIEGSVTATGALAMQIGDTFSTLYEKRCIVITLPDSEGEFIALDSDGVECSFHVSMIVESV